MNTLKQLCHQVEVNKQLGYKKVSITPELFEVLVTIAKTASTLSDWLDYDEGTSDGARLKALKEALSSLENQ